jgi:undecaprenyl-diphosphatase
MLAAGALEMLDLFKLPGLTSFLPVVAAGVITAAVFGYLSIRWLISYLMRHSLRVFAIYCVVLGALTVAVAYFKG